MLIVLNGSSSSGKTLTALALQKRLGSDTCVITGFDDILERIRPFEGKGLIRPCKIIWFQMTDGRFNLFRKLHREVAGKVQAGKAVIVETSFMEDRILRDAAECFAPLNGFLIGMKPPLEISEQWEAQRSDRPAGQARKHHDLIHAHGMYDLVIDPSEMTPDECALKIVDRVEKGQASAFSRLT
jgi:chloramphenicol 3-O phosphotransferase